MSQQPGFSPSVSPNAPNNPSGLAWSQTWIKAVTQPNEQAYLEIDSDTPARGNSKAYNWIFISAVIASLVSIVVNVLYPSSIAVPRDNAVITLQTFSLVNLLYVPVLALLSVLGFAIFVGITQFIAHALGGMGTYSRLLYTTAAFSAPMAILGAVLRLIPIINIVAPFLGLYSLYLEVLSVKVVNQFSWGKAFVAGVIIWVGIAAVIALVVYAVLEPAIVARYSRY